MAAGHIVSRRSHLDRKTEADFRRKHRKWPLGTYVMVKTPEGYLRGRVFKHWRRDEVPHGATVEFPFPVDMGDANGERFGHVIPFRSMKPVQNPHPYGRTKDGKKIVAPAGWHLLQEFEVIPQAHRECDENGQWLRPRSCHSTMTPLIACTSGYVRAFAVPQLNTPKELS